MLGWWVARRRRRLLASAEPRELREHLAAGVWQWNHLPDAVTDRAINWIRIFIAEKYWEGCGNHRYDFAQQATIAGQASLMTLAFPDWFFSGFRTLLIYPGDYVAPGITHMVNGQIGVHGEQPRSGETSYRGPVILNWAAVAAAGQSSNDGQSLCIHELAHQMDFVNGPTSDGVPPLPDTVDAQRWQQRMTSELEETRDQSRYGYSRLVSDYGLTSPGEFFAVSSELYFQLPHELGEQHPELFDLLFEFYQFDWRRWLPR
jgi:MtfA peptidase